MQMLIAPFKPGQCCICHIVISWKRNRFSQSTSSLSYRPTNSFALQLNIPVHSTLLHVKTSSLSQRSVHLCAPKHTVGSITSSNCIHVEMYGNTCRRTVNNSVPLYPDIHVHFSIWLCSRKGECLCNAWIIFLRTDLHIKSLCISRM